MTRSRFPSPADDYVESSINLTRELVPSPMSTEYITNSGDAMAGFGLLDGSLVLFDRARVPRSDSFVAALYEGEVIVRKVQGRPPRVALVAGDRATPPIWFGQGADPEILGTVILWVNALLQ